MVWQVVELPEHVLAPCGHRRSEAGVRNSATFHCTYRTCTACFARRAILPLQYTTWDSTPKQPQHLRRYPAAQFTN